MDIQYRRTAEGSYMIIEGQEESGGFEEQMLKRNDVTCLLSFHTLKLNGRQQFWYRISGMRSFSDIVMSEGITLKNLYLMFESIQSACRTLSKYLIDEEHLLFLPEAIYFSQKYGSFSAGLCYCPVPHESVCDQLGELMRFVIGQVDHNEPEITSLCYELHAVTEREDFSFYDLMDRLQTEYDKKCVSSPEAQGQGDFSYTAGIEERMQRAGIDLSEYNDRDDKEDVRDERKEPEAKKRGIKDKLLSMISAKLPKLITGRESFFPERRDFCDIQFDELPEDEGATVLLSEDDTGCRGKLIYESGGRGGSDIEIKKTPFSIGSKAGGNDAVLSSEAVSRYHARIIKQDGAFYLIDLNSKNGSCVNGELLPYNEPHRLSRMDMISFADMIYRVV